MNTRRIFEIDLFRALAILLMITFHVVYDLDWLTSLEINPQDPFWFWLGKLSALTFIFVSGISNGLSKGSSTRRGIKVLLYGLIITVLTYIFLRQEYVRFGILHFLGISMLFYPVIKKLRTALLLCLSVIIIGLGFYFKNITVNTFVLLPIGLMYPEFSTIDYYPLFPYLGVSLLGIIAYKEFYAKGKRLLKTNYESKLISYISKNSLTIYLIHQPLAISLLYLLFNI